MLLPVVHHAQVVDSSQYMYAALPDVLFPAGFLHDQSFLRDLHEGTDYDLHLFDGSIPGKMTTKRHGELAYNDLFLSQRLKNGLLFGLQPPKLKPWPEFERQSKAEDTLGVDISLYLNWFQVHELDTNALANGWLYYDNDQLTVMPNKLWLDQAQTVQWNTPNPMDSAQKAIQEFDVFFGGTNSVAHYISGQSVDLTFALMDYLVQSNRTLPTDFYLDLDDGQGFRKVAINQQVQATYSTTSTVSELIYKDLAIRIRHNNTWIESRFQIPLVFNVSKPDLVLHTDSLASPSCYTKKAPKKDASITVKYANKGLGLQKPVVLVEGFESSLQPYGLISYEGLSSGVILNENDEQVYKQMQKLAWLYDSLHGAGYDIVHVDFKESKQSIEDNTVSLVRALHWVNGQGADEPAIVVGASMGGLIARAALLELERYDCCQNISAYGTFDTPHDGAFVPLGVQMGAKRMEELTTILWTWSLVKTWSKALNSPTSRQMLIDHLDPSARGERADLVAFYNGEQPKTIRRFAISNGSDLNISAPLADSDDIIAQWGTTKRVTYKHRVHTHMDSLQFNKSGGDKRDVIGYGASIEGMNSASNFLYYGHNILSNTLNFRKIKFFSKFNARKALWVKRLDNWNVINSADADKAIIYIQNKSNDRLNRIHLAIQGNASKLDKKNFYHDYIEAPGSSTNSAEAFNKVWGSEILSPSHTFIPAFSALNVGEHYATQSFRGRMDIIPFHSYISPGLVDDIAGANQPHIYTDEDIIEYALHSFAGVHQEIGTNGVLKTDFNIAKEHNIYGTYPSHIEALEVSTGVTLGVGNQGFVGSSNVPADGDQNLEVFVGNGCVQGELRIKGTLMIGDVPGHFATLRINKGSTLVLDKNSSLFIGPGCELIVEEGATMIIEQGASIDWNDGAITLEGTLNMDSGVDFSPNGSGTLTFDADGNISPQSTGALRLEQSRINIKNLQHLSVNIAAVEFDECTLVFYNKGEFKVRSDFDLTNSTVRYDGSKQWAGLSVSSNTTTVSHCEFIGGAPALSVAVSSTFSLENSTFKNALQGLRSSTTPSSFYANKFYSCTIGAELRCRAMTIERNLFHGCDQGLIFTAMVKNAPIQLVRNVFSSNTTYGSNITDANVRMECNDWSYNAIGHMQSGGTLSLGSNAGNVFNSNTTALKFQSLQSLALNYGQNQFLNNAVLDIQGSFLNSAAVPHNGTHYFISTDYNSFTSSWSTDMVIGRSKVYPMKSPNTQPSSYVCPAKGPGKARGQGMDNTEQMALTIFPNPSSSPEIQVTFSPIQQEGTLEVYGSNGALIVSSELLPGSYTKTISVANTPGTYVVRLIAGGRIETARWVLL
jgi:pimeloyl-ACP methyl ester carboxylesterase